MFEFVKNFLGDVNQRNHAKLFDSSMDLTMQLAAKIQLRGITKDQIEAFCEAEENKREVTQLLVNFSILAGAFPHPELDLLRTMGGTPEWGKMPEEYRLGVAGLLNHAIKQRKGQGNKSPGR